VNSSADKASRNKLRSKTLQVLVQMIRREKFKSKPKKKLVRLTYGNIHTIEDLLTVINDERDH
jgi:hypothetical protein